MEISKSSTLYSSHLDKCNSLVFCIQKILLQDGRDFDQYLFITNNFNIYESGIYEKVLVLEQAKK